MMTIRQIIPLFCFILLGLNGQGYSANLMLTDIQDPAVMVDNEVERLSGLINATETSLSQQKKLKELILEYKRILEVYLNKSDDNDLLLKLVKSARRTLEAIKENHLMQTFDPEFINELSVLAQAASKRGVPKP